MLLIRPTAWEALATEGSHTVPSLPSSRTSPFGAASRFEEMLLVPGLAATMRCLSGGGHLASLDESLEVESMSLLDDFSSADEAEFSLVCTLRKNYAIT